MHWEKWCHDSVKLTWQSWHLCNDTLHWNWPNSLFTTLPWFLCCRNHGWLQCQGSDFWALEQQHRSSKHNAMITLHLVSLSFAESTTTVVASAADMMIWTAIFFFSIKPWCFSPHEIMCQCLINAASQHLLAFYHHLFLSLLPCLAFTVELEQWAQVAVLVCPQQ